MDNAGSLKLATVAANHIALRKYGEPRLVIFISVPVNSPDCLTATSSPAKATSCEAFSNLDNETALKIEKELLKLENITLIAVTHRLFEETLRNFDEILVLDNGKIIEKGTYNELINKKSFFYKMYSLSKND